MTEKKKYVYDYPHPAVTVDIIVFTMISGNLNVLLIKRGEQPFKDHWALPGGFVKENETVEAAARRELLEETGVGDCAPIQCGIYSEPGRDPRQRVISVAFYDCVRAADLKLHAGTDASDVKWLPIDQISNDELAFDHARILSDTLKILRKSCRETPIAAKMLTELFKLTEFQETIEIIIGETLDKRNFRRLLEDKNWIEATDIVSKGPYRPAKLYRMTNEDAGN